MGCKWDTGETAFTAEFWAEVLRVLKPGAFIAAFGATRGYHRMTCAIEDAGFEIRDSLMWVYGTGFPKSHDVSKGIDKTNGETGRALKFTTWMRSTGLKSSEIDRITGTNMGGHYTTLASQPAVPTRALFEMMRPHITAEIPEWIEMLINRVEAEREVVAQSKNGIAGGSGEFVAGNDKSAGYAAEFNITAPATPAAREWEGWGTALKPAFEPIVLARKPLSESTVAANVLRWRTGALNIGASRIGTEVLPEMRAGQAKLGTFERDDMVTPERVGRWPANVVHDGSDEVIEAFPNTNAAARPGKAARARPTGGASRGAMAGTDALAPHYGDTGSAARFFYSAKASRADRAGSKHPTVKPVSLMQWLARLITPPGGTVLDPFAGSGTTGAAALAEGFNCILVEREAEYVADIISRFEKC